MFTILCSTYAWIGNELSRWPFYFLLPVVANRHLRHFTPSIPLCFHFNVKYFSNLDDFLCEIAASYPCPPVEGAAPTAECHSPGTRRSGRRSTQGWGKKLTEVGPGDTEHSPQVLAQKLNLTPFAFGKKNHWFLPRGQNKQPPSGRKFLSFLPSCNSVVSVSEPWRAFWGDKVPF